MKYHITTTIYKKRNILKTIECYSNRHVKLIDILKLSRLTPKQLMNVRIQKDCKSIEKIKSFCDTIDTQHLSLYIE
jgi:hypothetical protein